jgi:TolA-binding protein
MSIVDLHPEELLDKHARGLLSEQERIRLDAHAATCAVCRFELFARDDFASEASAMLGSPLGTKHPAPDASTEELAPAPRLAARSRRRAWVVGVAAALIGGMSFAALSSGVLRSERTTPPMPKSAAHAAPTVAKHVAPSLPEQGAIASTEEATTLPPPGRTNDAAEAPSHETAPAHAARTTPTAAELFRNANAARRAHDSERAIALYRELEARYPRSEEARVSYATLGTLMLDHGDARAALDGFNRYLARGETALGEEALVGRALASRKLGAREAEITAWQEVLRRFPSSIHAELARTRLAELGDR